MMPAVMPSVIPNLLINGSDGIAVGMATKIPPHNIREICNGLVALLNNPDMEFSQLLELIQGPDFPTGGIIHGRGGIRDYIETGRGRLVVRARTDIEVEESGRSKIIVTELPYQVNKSALIEKIADLVRAGHLEGISDLRDESDREGMRIVVILKRGAYPQVVLNKLFAHTPMQSTFGVINLALVDNRPKVMSLKETMQEYLIFREEVVVRRTQFDLGKAEERAHILEGYLKALDHIDEVVELIKNSESPQVASVELQARFELTEKQAEAILALRLARLTGLERRKIEDEYRLKIEQIAELKAILDSRDLVLGIIREELERVGDKYGDERRTEIVEEEGQLNLEDLIADEEMVVTISNQGYIKRIPADTYRRQGRGGKGITAMATKDEDFVEHLFIASTHQFLLVLTEKGTCYWLKVHEIPKGSRTSRGRPIVNLLRVLPGDKVHAVVPVRKFREDQFLALATSMGIIKRTPLVEFSRPRAAGIKAINLLWGERLVAVRVTDGKGDIVMASTGGMVIRFDENEARPMGRSARGVRGISLGKGEKVVGMVIVRDNQDHLLSVTENGYGKRTPLADYRRQGRGGKGIITIKCSERNGPLVAIRNVKPAEEMMVVTRNGIMIRVSVDGISIQGRNTQGVRIIALKEGDGVGGITKVAGNENGKDPEGAAGVSEGEGSAGEPDEGGETQN
jgi:DNA gyrase subunit A